MKRKAVKGKNKRVGRNKKGKGRGKQRKEGGNEKGRERQGKEDKLYEMRENKKQT